MQKAVSIFLGRALSVRGDVFPDEPIDIVIDPVDLVDPARLVVDSVEDLGRSGRRPFGRAMLFGRLGYLLDGIRGLLDGVAFRSIRSLRLQALDGRLVFAGSRRPRRRIRPHRRRRVRSRQSR